jgi:RNA polymerase sigma-70 factor (ECF subfamily)
MVQNVIIRLENHLDKITEITSKKTRAYLMIIVRNLSINAYNKRKKTVLMDNDLAEGLLEEYNEIYFENEPTIELCRELETSLSQLNESYTDILTLRYFYELTIDEIANILDMSKNVVNVKLHRARAALKSIMMKEGR